MFLTYFNSLRNGRHRVRTFSLLFYASGWVLCIPAEKLIPCPIPRRSSRMFSSDHSRKSSKNLTTYLLVLGRLLR